MSKDPFNIFRVLIKFMDEQYIDSFLNEGLLYMNNIGWFRALEDSNIALRGDVHEGLFASFRAEDMEMMIGDHKIEDAIDKVDIRYNDDDNTNIYSMTKISDGHILSSGDSGLFLSERFQEFGTHAVVIGGSNIGEFQKRLISSVKKQNNISPTNQENTIAKQVQYVDRGQHHGKMDVFTKFKEYDWQYEWRIAFKQTVDSGPYELKIGPLKDIAFVSETASLLNSPLQLVPKQAV